MKEKRKTRAERLAEMRVLHDKIKEHPYWMTFDAKFLPSLLEDFRELTLTVWDSADNTSPYYVVLRAVTHDFNKMLSNVREWLKHDKFKPHEGSVIAVMQAYLMNIHRLLDGGDADGAVVGFTYFGKDLEKYEALYDEEEKTYYAVNVVKRSYLPEIEKILTKFGRCCSKGTRELVEECRRDIEEGRQIIGKMWKITD